MGDECEGRCEDEEVLFLARAVGAEVDGWGIDGPKKRVAELKLSKRSNGLRVGTSCNLGG